MIILALDTTMGGCSACLYDDVKGIIQSKSLEMLRGQAEHLMPLIDGLVTDYKDIDLIAVTKGPGAFTGMRIGIATAKALGLALGIPVIGVCTFKAVLGTYKNIESADSHDFYGVLLETKRQDYYFQMFEGDIINEGSAMTAQDIIAAIGDRKCMMLGDASERFKGEIAQNTSLSFYDIILPAPSVVAQIALLEYNENDGEVECSPAYLRMPEIGTPKNKARKLKQI